ncbi:MAG: FAD-binding oxidoreductase, partial [Burkholderiales bacterium]
MDNPIQLLGLAAVAALAGYMLSLVAGQFLSSQRQARFSELELKLLQAKVEHQLEEVRFGQNRRKSAWAGYRKFLVREKTQECDGVCSFVLTPHDGKPVQTFLPGQYLTFQLQIPGVSKPVVRCYSISDSPAATDCYRVSIKRIPPGADNAPPGLVSNYFHSL